MAEGLLKSIGKSEFKVFSAGTHPMPVRPQAVQVMKEIGIDISDQYSKTLDGFVDQPFDYVITVCDNAKESCPVFYGAKQTLHWSIEDPVGVLGTEKMRLQAFRKARDEINAEDRGRHLGWPGLEEEVLGSAYFLDNHGRISISSLRFRHCEITFIWLLFSLQEEILYDCCLYLKDGSRSIGTLTFNQGGERCSSGRLRRTVPSPP